MAKEPKRPDPKSKPGQGGRAQQEQEKQKPAARTNGKRGH